jgi:hypothetical protein
LCFYRTAFTVQKSGLKSLAFRSKPFPQIWPKSYRRSAVPNRFLSQFSTSRTTAAFAFTGEIEYTLGFAQRIAHSGSQGQTSQIEDGLQRGQIVVHTVIQPTVCCFL